MCVQAMHWQGKVVYVASTLEVVVVESVAFLHKGSFCGRGIWEETSESRHLGGGMRRVGRAICNGASRRKHLGGGIRGRIYEEASRRRRTPLGFPPWSKW